MSVSQRNGVLSAQTQPSFSPLAPLSHTTTNCLCCFTRAFWAGSFQSPLILPKGRGELEMGRTICSVPWYRKPEGMSRRDTGAVRRQAGWCSSSPVFHLLSSPLCRQTPQPGSPSVLLRDVHVAIPSRLAEQPQYFSDSSAQQHCRLPKRKHSNPELPAHPITQHSFDRDARIWPLSYRKFPVRLSIQG